MRHSRMRFRFEAHELRTSATDKRFLYDLELSDVRELLSDVCGLLQDAGATFTVSGFGLTNWPVNVETDFSIFLEQLPAALHALSLRESFSIDFYEQGIERYLEFRPLERGYDVRCGGRGEGDEVVDDAELERQFTEIRNAFLIATEQVAPQAAKHPWFERWRESSRNAR